MEVFHKLQDTIQNFDYQGTADLAMAKATVAWNTSYEAASSGAVKGLGFLE
jgi:hypothetical protein